jgi:argininosuccinate lyase
VGKAVAHGIANGQDLAEMSLDTLQGFCADIREDVFAVLTL